MFNKKLRILFKDVSYRVPFGEYILQHLALAVHEGDKIALIGRNGTGKTTFLRFITGDLKPTKGEVEKYGKVVYLPQVHFDLPKEKELYEFIAEFAEDWWEVLEYAKTRFSMPDISPNRPIGTLSGGELMKIYLSKFLMAEPDILLLDEPTNHIDVLSLEVLVKTLKEFKGTVIAATHDTFFINQFADKVVEIDETTLHSYGGNYDHYVHMKLTHDNAHERKVFAFKVKKNRLNRALKIESKRAQRSVEVGKKLAAGDRSTSRAARGYLKEKAAKATAKITSSLESKKSRVIEKLQVMEKVPPKTVQFKFVDNMSTPDDLLIQYKESDLIVGGVKLLSDMNFIIKRAERIAVLGRNGAGKTLFLKSLIGQDKDKIQVTGEILRSEQVAEYIGQDFAKVVSLHTEDSQNIMAALEGNKTSVYKHLVGQLGLSSLDVHREVDSFSGGELTKLMLLDLSNKPLDMLILDEPTNHLDISSQNALVSALNSFPGTLIVTSHKLDFITKLKLTKAYLIVEGKLELIEANLADPQEIYKKMLKLA